MKCYIVGNKQLDLLSNAVSIKLVPFTQDLPLLGNLNVSRVQAQSEYVAEHKGREDDSHQARVATDDLKLGLRPKEFDSKQRTTTLKSIPQRIHGTIAYLPTWKP